MDVRHAAIQYVQFLHASGYSPNTIANVASCLLLFQHRFNNPLVVEAAKYAVEFLAWRAQTVKRNSLCANFAHLRGFFRWCVQEGYIDKSPLERMHYPKQEKIVTQPLSDAELFQILDHAEGWERPAFLLLLGSGMRVGELAGLKWSDFHDGVLTVTGKGSKQRTVHPGSVALRELMTLPRQGNLVFGRSYSGVKDGFRRLSRRSGVPFFPHQVRHTFAALFMENSGGDILSLQALMGHASIQTTQIYLAAYQRDHALKQQQRCNPCDTLLGGRTTRAAVAQGMSGPSGTSS